jgi:hypothetical protein
LLGAGIVEGKRRSGLAGNRRFDDTFTLQQLCDAEIEQANLTFIGHQNVGGLQVAMHDQATVRVRHGAGHLQE